MGTDDKESLELDQSSKPVVLNEKSYSTTISEHLRHISKRTAILIVAGAVIVSGGLLYLFPSIRATVAQGPVGIRQYEEMPYPPIETKTLPSGYETYDQMIGRLQQFAIDYPDLVELLVIGNTVNGRPIYSITISQKAITGSKIPVLGLGGHHGDEIVGPFAIMRIIESLLTGYMNNATIRFLLDTRKIVFVPVVNVDGYDALNRCNARRVDLNRNNRFGWKDIDLRECKDSGSGPVSEPESAALEQLLNSLFGDYRADDWTSKASSASRGFGITIHSAYPEGGILWVWCRDDRPGPDEHYFAIVADRLSKILGYKLASPGSGLAGEAPGCIEDTGYGMRGVMWVTEEAKASSDIVPVSISEQNARVLMKAFLESAILAEGPFRYHPELERTSATMSTLVTPEQNATVTIRANQGSVVKFFTTPPELGGTPILTAPLVNGVATATITNAIGLVDGEYVLSAQVCRTDGTCGPIRPIDFLQVARARANVTVKTSEGQPLANASVCSSRNVCDVTDSNGTAQFYIFGGPNLLTVFRRDCENNTFYEAEKAVNIPSGGSSNINMTTTESTGFCLFLPVISRNYP